MTVLRNFNLSIAASKLVALVDNNGYSRSTLLRMLMGLKPTTRRDIHISGELATGVSKEYGIVFQELRLFPWLDALNNTMFGLADEKLTQATKRQRALEVLTHTQLSEFTNALPAQLSGGMARRVVIARGLVAHPQILVLGRPFGALDALTRHALQQRLLQIHQSMGTTILLATHDVRGAVTLADRVVMLSPHLGRTQEIMSPALPHPRQHDDDSFIAAYRYIRNLITSA